MSNARVTAVHAFSRRTATSDLGTERTTFTYVQRTGPYPESAVYRAVARSPSLPPPSLLDVSPLRSSVFFGAANSLNSRRAYFQNYPETFSRRRIVNEFAQNDNRLISETENSRTRTRYLFSLGTVECVGTIQIQKTRTPKRYVRVFHAFTYGPNV